MKHVRILGREKHINFINDFDFIVDKYRKISDASNYNGELVFKKEGGFIVVFVELEKDGER